MRIYARAEVPAVVARLLDDPLVADAVVADRTLPARAADLQPFPGWLDERLRAGLRARGIEALYSHQAEALEAPPCRARRLRGHADGLWQVALLRPAGPPGRHRRSVRTGALPLPDQGARPGSAGGAAGLRRAGRRRPRGRHLRRRHADADPPDHPGRRPGRGHEPGHAPRRDPAPPHEVVPALRAAPLHRRRRGAHLPRCLRQPRRQRDPAPAAALRALRQPPGHRHLLGDHRQPAGAGRGPDGPSAGARRPERGAGGREARR